MVGLDQNSYETFYLLVQQIMTFRAEVGLLLGQYGEVDFFSHKLNLLSVRTHVTFWRIHKCLKAGIVHLKVLLN